MSSEGPSENVSNTAIRFCNLRLNNEESEEAAAGPETENTEAFSDSSHNMQPAVNIMLNRARRALTYSYDEDQVSLSSRSGEPSTSNCDK